MSKTVIGVFSNSSQAQDAKSYLLSNGFSAENIDINSNTASDSYTGGATGTTGTTSEPGVGDRVSNFFKNIFEDEDDANSHIAAGQKGVIVTVHAQTHDEALEASEVLNNYGALDVNDAIGSARSTSDTYAAESANPDSIKVIQEDLQVGKREVETGGVRLRSHIVERPVEESIRLREEHVSVNRTAVNRPATEADFTGFREGAVEMKEYAERPVVSKEARVVEEVSLGKEVSEKQETIKDTVRHTEVDTEQIPASEKTYRAGTDGSSTKI